MDSEARKVVLVAQDWAATPRTRDGQPVAAAPTISASRSCPVSMCSPASAACSRARIRSSWSRAGRCRTTRARDWSHDDAGLVLLVRLVPVVLLAPPSACARCHAASPCSPCWRMLIAGAMFIRPSLPVNRRIC